MSQPQILIDPDEAKRIEKNLISVTGHFQLSKFTNYQIRVT